MTVKQEQYIENDVIVGIDLGTTNSLIAVAVSDVAQVIVCDSGKGITPSVVSYVIKDESAHQVLVGESALKEISKQQRVNTIHSVKRLMGKGINDYKDYYDFALHPDSSEQTIMLDIEGRAVSPIEISGEILKVLKEQAEKFLKKKVSKAIITVPAHFDDAARLATKQAALLADLDVIRLINEPTAAAIAYGLDRKENGIFLVYDFGGGTFDISILKMQEGIIQVIATIGDNNLGGDDIDRAILEYIQNKFQINSTGDYNGISAILHAKKLKEILSLDEVAEIEHCGINITLTKSEFLVLLEPFVNRTINFMGKAIKEAKIERSQVKEVILVGGTTRIPYIKDSIEKFIGKKPLDHINPEEIVAIGASIQAGRLVSSSNELLLDVVPLSLGIELMGGVVEHIIKRNTPIPVSVTKIYTTYQDNQTGFVIHVLQGESENVNDCRSLAKFELKGLNRLDAGCTKLAVTFRIDADGVLEVIAEDIATKQVHAVFVKPSFGLTDDQMLKLLDVSHN